MTHWFKLYSLGLIVTVVGLAIGVHAQAGMYKGYETTPYAVMASDGAVELRRYAPHIVAEIDVEGSREQAIRRGFRALAASVSGANETRDTVEMIVPVSQFAESDGWTIRFIMPAVYGIGIWPKLASPASDAIRFVEIPTEDQLVLRFKGIPTAQKLAEKSDELAAYARSKGFSSIGEPRFHFYDDPFTLPWKRRNEVSLQVS